MATSHPLADGDERFSLSASECCCCVAPSSLCLLPSTSSKDRGLSADSSPPERSLLWVPAPAGPPLSPSPQHTCIRPLLVTGFSSDTHPHAPSASRQQAPPSVVSRRRLALRSGGEGTEPCWPCRCCGDGGCCCCCCCGLWGQGLRTFRRGGVRGSAAGDPGVRDSH